MNAMTNDRSLALRMTNEGGAARRLVKSFVIRHSSFVV
jgi:hypothetical protein